jgi:hypothetical protein
MYILSRKNGSFPGGKRTMRFFTYDEMRVFLRSYFRHFMEWQYPRSTHPSMRFMTLVLGITIKKERV